MRITKPLWIAAGCVAMALGALGVPLPMLPTTPFLLLAAFCFAKGSARLDAWFRSTRLYQRHLASFVASRAMTLKTKLCILLPASLMLLAAFAGMSRKDTTGTRIGRATILVLLAFKYWYFFARIRTIRADGTGALSAERTDTAVSGIAAGADASAPLAERADAAVSGIAAGADASAPLAERADAAVSGTVAAADTSALSAERADAAVSGTAAKAAASAPAADHGADALTAAGAPRA